MADIRRVVEIDVKTSAQAVATMRQIADQMDRMERKFDDVTKAASLFGQRIVEFFSVRSIIGQIRATAEAFDEMGKRAERVGVGIEALSALSYQARLANVSAQSLDTALGKLNQNLVAMDDKTSNGTKALNELRVTAKDPARALEQIAEAFAGMENGAKKTALAFEVFGKGGNVLIPMLNEGAAGMARAREEAEALGLIMTEDAAKAAQTFNDNMTRLGGVIEGVRNRMIAPLISALADLTNAFLGAGTAALTMGERMALAFSGDVNIGKRVELVQQLEQLQASFDKAQASGSARADTLAKGIAHLKEEIAKLDRLLNIRDAVNKAQAAEAARARFVAGERDAAGDAAARAKEAERAARELEKIKQELDAIADSALKGVKGFDSLWVAAGKFIAMTTGGQITALNKQLQELAYLENSGAIDADLAAEARGKLERQIRKLGDAYEQLQVELEEDSEKEQRLIDRQQALARMFYDGEITLDKYMEKLRAMGLATEETTTKSTDSWLQMAEAIQRSIEGWSSRAAQAVVDFAHGVESSFADMVKNILKEMERMAIQMLVMDPLFKAFAASIRGAMNPTAGAGLFERLGDAFAPGGNLLALAGGGVVRSPTFFRFAGGAGVMGEAGPEAIMPLKRTASGALGVEAAAGGGGVTVNVINSAGADVSVQEGRDATGQRTVNIMVEHAVQDAFARGKFDSLMSATYGLSRRGR